MKATKKIVGATAALVAAIALSAGSTFAWFASNTEVSATGMNIGVTEASDMNLLIRAMQSGGTYGAYGTTATFNHGNKKLTPSTHDNDYTTYSSGLKYVASAEDVDPITGIYNGSTYNPATVNTHYIDYTVELANAGENAVADKYLQVSVSGTTIGDTQKAISIDFYAGGDASQSTFITTVNLVNSTNEINLGDSTVTIPAAGEGRDQNGYKVVMRVYVDGALQKGDVAYVNSNSVTLDGVDITIGFSAVDSIS